MTVDEGHAHDAAQRRVRRDLAHFGVEFGAGRTSAPDAPRDVVDRIAAALRSARHAGESTDGAPEPR